MKQSQSARAQRLYLPESIAEPFAPLNFGKAPMAQNLRSSKEPIVVAHSCRCPVLHMIQNALLAVAAGRAFGLSIEECAAGLAAAPLTKARLQIKEVRGVQFIDDSYNANPDSMTAALRTLVELDARKENGSLFSAKCASSAANRNAAMLRLGKRRLSSGSID